MARVVILVGLVGLVGVVAAGCNRALGLERTIPVDGPPDAPDGPPDAPPDAPGPLVVFVTSVGYTGLELGGLVGADAKCQAHAAIGGLPGNFEAWLAVDNDSPQTRMTHHPGRYQLANTIPVADGWSDLVDGTLAHAIDLDEKGNPAPAVLVCGGGEVWSNVDGAGLRRTTTGDCTGWTIDTGAGPAGNVNYTDVRWTADDGCPNISCSSSLPIYCVEQ